MGLVAVVFPTLVKGGWLQLRGTPQLKLSCVVQAVALTQADAALRRACNLQVGGAAGTVSEGPAMRAV